MIIGVNPVTDVQTVAIQLRTNTFQDISDLSRDELFHVLVRTVVVGAVGDGHAHTEGTAPCADQQIELAFVESTGWKDGKAFPR